jgi:hypothetical protein
MIAHFALSINDLDALPQLARRFRILRLTPAAGAEMRSRSTT